MTVSTSYKLTSEFVSGENLQMSQHLESEEKSSDTRSVSKSTEFISDYLEKKPGDLK